MKPSACRSSRLPELAPTWATSTHYTVGYRYNPFMTSRAGFAWHNEFNIFHQTWSIGAVANQYQHQRTVDGI
jgi:hypothetical protein